MNKLVPESIEQAVELLKAGYRPVGGGTDFIVRRHALLKSDPANSGSGSIFSCKKIAGTGRLTAENRKFLIGSSVTLSEIISHPGCPEPLRESLKSIAAPGIRNAATLAGNICNASPAADSLPALYILNASVTVNGENGIRNIPIQDFITGPGKTELSAAEIVTGIFCDIPDCSEGRTFVTFRKVGTRAANALSKLSIAALIKTENNIFSDFRLAIGACAPVVIRSRDAEKFFTGSRIEDTALLTDKLINMYDDLVNPIDDQRSTAEYRKNTALRLVEKVIIDAVDKTGE